MAVAKWTGGDDDKNRGDNVVREESESAGLPPVKGTSSRGDNVIPPQPTTDEERDAMLARRMAREARDHAINNGPVQDVPGDYDSEALLLRATLAGTPTGIEQAKRWGEELPKKRGTTTPAGVAASKPTGPREQS